MLVFIFCSLSIGFLVKTDSPFLSLIISPVTLYLGFGFILCSAIATLSKRIHFSYAYDGFSTGALLVWFSYWHQFFKNETPMFYFFPLYFAFVTALVTVIFLKRDDWVDQESLTAMQHFSNFLRFHPITIAALVLISLEMHSHFLLFPTMMTLFIMRYVFTSYLAEHQS